MASSPEYLANAEVALQCVSLPFSCILGGDTNDINELFVCELDTWYGHGGEGQRRILKAFHEYAAHGTVHVERFTGEYAPDKGDEKPVEKDTVQRELKPCLISANYAYGEDDDLNKLQETSKNV